MACFGITKNSSRVCTEYSSGIFPSAREPAYFCNIGRTSLECQLIYGTAISWYGVITSSTLAPGEEKTLHPGGRLYYVVGRKVINKTNIRGIIYCGGSGDDSGSSFNIDVSGIAKKLALFGVGQIPYAGSVLSELVDFFWPDNSPSVWEQIKDQVQNAIDSKVKEAIQAILGGDIRYYKERIATLESKLKDPNPSAHNFKATYMRIAEDLVGFEQKFRFSKQDHSNYQDMNCYILPLYSSVVNLKVLFYKFGIINKEKLHLTDNDVYDIKTYLKRVIEYKDGALIYINQVFNEQFDNVYENCSPNKIYDSLAEVRTWCTINGLEFIPIWKAIINDPYNKSEPYNDVISYSKHFSRLTLNLQKQLIPDEIAAPLQPKLINGKRNKMTKIDVWIFRIRGGTPKINGIRIYYENGDKVDCGTYSNEIQTVDFKGAYLKSLQVWGWGALDMLTFEFTDGRKQNCGNNNEARGFNEKFELPHHHIAGIILTNDAIMLAGQAANIGVSYQPTPSL